MVFLRLNEIFKYCECDVNSRNFNEGEAILMANQVMLVGQEKVVTVEDEIKIYALVFQTSNFSGFPHVIQGSICRKSFTVKTFNCSCKAGAGGKCEHITAVLLYLYRNDLMQLEKISSTDVKNLRSRGKKSVLKKLHKTTPIDEFCCVESVQKIRDEYQAIMTPELEKEIWKTIKEALPAGSALLRVANELEDPKLV